MVSPLRDLLAAVDCDADQLRPSSGADREQAENAGQRPGEPATINDLERLECSVQWLKHEVMVVRLEAAIHTEKGRRRLPRASQLKPVNAEGSCREREKLTFHVAPPLASERLQVPTALRQRTNNLRGPVCFLIAGAIAGLIAYHISMGGVFPAPEPAQAASVQAR
jgi:hypothetical protein